jgi:hypothetical protein
MISRLYERGKSLGVAPVASITLPVVDKPKEVDILGSSFRVMRCCTSTWTSNPACSPHKWLTAADNSFCNGSVPRMKLFIGLTDNRPEDNFLWSLLETTMAKSSLCCHYSVE